MKVSREEFFQIVAEEAARDFDPMTLVYPAEVPVFDKYDEYLPTSLVRKEFAYSILDIAQMRKTVASWSRVDSEPNAASADAAGAAQGNLLTRRH